MTLCPYFEVGGVTKKGVSEHGFQTLECDTPKTECELNHTSECQTFTVIKSKSKRAFLEGNSQEK